MRKPAKTEHVGRAHPVDGPNANRLRELSAALPSGRSWHARLFASLLRRQQSQSLKHLAAELRDERREG